ncbi:unnamed protein product [Calypogeia fissa]
MASRCRERERIQGAPAAVENQSSSGRKRTTGGFGRQQRTHGGSSGLASQTLIRNIAGEPSMSKSIVLRRLPAGRVPTARKSESSLPPRMRPKDGLNITLL